METFAIPLPAAKGRPVPSRWRALGFTMPELMAALAIMGILAASAAPSFRELIAKQRVKQTATDLMIALSTTRSEALKRGVDMTLAPVSDDSWMTGWRIANPAHTGTYVLSHGATASGVTITGPASVGYRISGRITASTAPTFSIGAANTAAAYCITVNTSGRPVKTAASC